MKTIMKLWFSGAVLALVLAPFAAAAPGKLPPPSKRQGVTYDKDIKPLFEVSCIKCHGPEKQKSKLRLDSLEATLKGGAEGKGVIPGKSAESRLVVFVARQAEDEEYNMPPEGKAEPLTAEQVGLIRAWIDQGAK